ncbi:MAG: hypothetical protein KDJ52_08520 [Anaerolineae bacterium]|nr:hypothetical protein [Anaerolineae bacterium]
MYRQYSISTLLEMAELLADREYFGHITLVKQGAMWKVTIGSSTFLAEFETEEESLEYEDDKLFNVLQHALKEKIDKCVRPVPPAPTDHPMIKSIEEEAKRRGL